MSQNQYSVTNQVDPTPNEHPACWQVVIQDLKKDELPPNLGSILIRNALVKDMNDRDEWGRSKYGVPLQPFNGRDALVDLYQEILDATVYTKQYQLENLNDVRMGEVFERLLDSLLNIRGRILERDGK